jgi:hypothetical protein
MLDSAHEAMTPDQRRQDVAEILAAAIVRLRLRAVLPEVADSEKLLENTSNCLDASRETVLSVRTG